MNRPDYYRLLHVQRDAPTAVIKAIYRTLMQRLRMHPDLGGDHAQAVLLNEALTILGDPNKRAAYDRTLPPERTAPAPQASSNQAPAQESPEAAPTAAASPAEVPRAAAPRRAPTCFFCEAPVAAASVEWPDNACHVCGSAMFPAKTHQLGEQSRRAIARVPRSMPMTFRRSTEQQAVYVGTTEDISLNGARFVTKTDVCSGELLSIECEFCSAVAVIKGVRTSAEHGKNHRQVRVEFLTLRIKHVRGGLVSSVA